MLTVLSWLWDQTGGRTTYTPEHVATWAAMVARNLAMPHRIACVTAAEIPSHIERIAPPGEFEDVVTRRWTNGRPNCFRRLAMFRRDAAALFGDRFVCMDLDSVICAQLDPLFERDEDVVLFKGTAPGRPYNGSMMLIRAGSRPHVYEDFSREAAEAAGERFVGSDQAWLSHALGPDEPVWSEADRVYWYGGQYKREMRLRRAKPRIIFFPGGMKPWHAVGQFEPNVIKHYHAGEPAAREAA
jgi:hypothetical protein